MTYAGARGNTARQMADVLHFALEQARLHPAFADLIGGMQDSPEKPGYQLTIANALWGQQGFGFLKEFLELTRSYYEAGLHEVDFRTDREREATRKIINEWVKQKTEKKIQDLIPPGILDRLTRLVLTNAIYFKGKWTYLFRKDKTKNELFNLLNGKQVIVPMMNQTRNFRYMENNKIQMLELPYIGDELAMVVLLPRRVAGLPDLEHSLTGEQVTSWMSQLYMPKVIVSMPKFEMTSMFSLAKVLASMGMTDAFDRKVADFSAMNGTKNLFISTVVHKAFVDVNEEGTKAAAATAVVMKIKSSRPKPKHFRANHPFLFLIRDIRTKSILFLGRVMNPNDMPYATEDEIRKIMDGRKGRT
jgi:serpin B